MKISLALGIIKNSIAVIGFPLLKDTHKFFIRLWILQTDHSFELPIITGAPDKSN